MEKLQIVKHQAVSREMKWVMISNFRDQRLFKKTIQVVSNGCDRKLFHSEIDKVVAQDTSLSSNPFGLREFG